METENSLNPSVDSKEKRRKWIAAELERLKVGFGDSSQDEIRNKKMQALEKELYELDPPPGF